MWIYEYPDELQHYGVLGMKWGVRRNSLKAYSKASKKAAKLNNEKNAASAEVERLKKALAYAEVNSLQRSEKAEKWMSQMDKVFSDKNLSKIEAKHVKKGEAFYKKASEIHFDEPGPEEKRWSKDMGKADDHFREAEKVRLLKQDKEAAMRVYERRKK